LQKIVSQLAILGENISQEDLNLKFLRSLPSEWNTHVVVWRNKPDLDSMSFDDLYNNFKIVEQEVKITVTSSLNSGSQNMAFVSTPSSTNEINTANVQVSTANSTVSTDSALDSTANLNDHEDMDLKWQLALLSMRARRYYQRTRKKITINGSDTAGYDKSKVECFNCHKMGHFARECKGPRNQENRPRNQDSSRRTVNVEDTSSKAMEAIDGDDSEVHNNKTCSNTCLKSFETLKTQLDNLRVEFNKFEFNLAYVKEQLVFYKKIEVMFCDQIAVLKRDASFKDSEITTLNIQIEKLKKEKESNQIKNDNFENASKSLDKLIGSQISDNNRKGEFQQPEFEGYGFKDNKSVCENSSNEIKKTTDAPIIEDWVPDCDEDDSEVMILKSDNVQHKPEQANQPKKVSQNLRNNKTKWNEIKTQKLEVRISKIDCLLSSEVLFEGRLMMSDIALQLVMRLSIRSWGEQNGKVCHSTSFLANAEHDMWSQVSSYHIGDVDAQTRFEAASKRPIASSLKRLHTWEVGRQYETNGELMEFFDQERKEADDIDWSKIVEQAQKRQSGSEPSQEQSTVEPKELSEDLKEMLEIVLIEETKAEALQVKYPIVDWEVHTEGSRKY
ncbi:ribonuclease H-like domain-containing protein, partial [Tanacetum coccineum]